MAGLCQKIDREAVVIVVELRVWQHSLLPPPRSCLYLPGPRAGYPPSSVGHFETVEIGMVMRFKWVVVLQNHVQ